MIKFETSVSVAIYSSVVRNNSLKQYLSNIVLLLCRSMMHSVSPLPSPQKPTSEPQKPTSEEPTEKSAGVYTVLFTQFKLKCCFCTDETTATSIRGMTDHFK